MNGLPPTPPSTGCFGIVMVCPAGCSARSTCLSKVVSCVPFRLLLKLISTPKPPSAATPSSVMFGPGLLLQFVTVRAAFTLTGNGSSVMLMWGRDDEEANEGASGWREFSRHAPVRRKAPAKARNVLVRMIRFSFLHGNGCQNCESVRSHARRCGRTRVGQGVCRDEAWSAQPALVSRGGNNG